MDFKIDLEDQMKRRDGIIRIGGVGTGRIFQYAHLRAYPVFRERARLVGFYDLNGERAKEARDKYEGMLREWAEKHPDRAVDYRANIDELRVHNSLDSLLEQVDAVFSRTRTDGSSSV